MGMRMAFVYLLTVYAAWTRPTLLAGIFTITLSRTVITTYCFESLSYRLTARTCCCYRDWAGRTAAWIRSASTPYLRLDHMTFIILYLILYLMTWYSNCMPWAGPLTKLIIFHAVTYSIGPCISSRYLRILFPLSIKVQHEFRSSKTYIEIFCSRYASHGFPWFVSRGTFLNLYIVILSSRFTYCWIVMELVRSINAQWPWYLIRAYKGRFNSLTLGIELVTLVRELQSHISQIFVGSWLINDNVGISDLDCLLPFKIRNQCLISHIAESDLITTGQITFAQNRINQRWRCTTTLNRCHGIFNDQIGWCKAFSLLCCKSIPVLLYLSGITFQIYIKLCCYWCSLGCNCLLCRGCSDLELTDSISSCCAGTTKSKIRVTKITSLAVITICRHTGISLTFETSTWRRAMIIVEPWAYTIGIILGYFTIII